MLILEETGHLTLQYSAGAHLVVPNVEGRQVLGPPDTLQGGVALALLPDVSSAHQPYLPADKSGSGLRITSDHIG